MVLGVFRLSAAITLSARHVRFTSSRDLVCVHRGQRHDPRVGGYDTLASPAYHLPYRTDRGRASLVAPAGGGVPSKGGEGRCPSSTARSYRSSLASAGRFASV